MVVKSLNEYMLDTMLDRVKELQDALHQAENIIIKLEVENQSLKDALISLASNDEGYILDSEAFNEPMFAA